MPPRKPTGSDIGEALAAARVTGSELREALAAANGMAPEPADDTAAYWPGRPARQRLRQLGRVLSRRDSWMFIAIGVTALAAVVTAFFTYLMLVRPQ